MILTGEISSMWSILLKQIANFPTQADAQAEGPGNQIVLVACPKRNSELFIDFSFNV